MRQFRLSPSLLIMATIVILPNPVHAQKTVFLVRHAERVDGQDALTQKGQKRAQALAGLLKDTGVTQVIRSDTNRTRDTAAPTAAQFGIVPKVILGDATHVNNVVAQIMAADDQAVILYVGHSDTIKPILDKLGSTLQFSIPDDEFDNLFILIPKQPSPSVVRLRYLGAN